MRILLDTQVLLWASTEDPRLSSNAKKYLLDEHEIFFSVISYWEIVIKFQTGKLKLLPDPITFLENQSAIFQLKHLHVDFLHVENLTKLPLHHSDPFDRMLIAQAVSEHLPILSSDKQFKRYDIEVLW